MHIRIILRFFFEKYKCSGIAFFLQSSRYISNEQSCLKTTGVYGYLLLLSGLTFCVSYSVLPFHSVYALQFFHLFFFLMFFLKPLSSVVEMLLYTCVCVCVCVYSILYIYICYFRKLMKFFLTKKVMTFWFHLFDLGWIEC